MKFLFCSILYSLLTFSVFGQSVFNTEGLKITPLQARWTTPEALSFLDDVSDYNFYCASDWHKTTMALEQKKGFVIYLKEKKGLEKLVIEQPYAYGYWINQYLATGDTLLLRNVTDKQWDFDRHQKDLEISHNSFEFFRWLYTFNKQQINPIEVVGLDLNRFLGASLELWSVQQFLLRDSIYKSFDKSYTQLVKLVDTELPEIRDIKKWKSEFTKELAVNKAIVKFTLVTDYSEFEKILISIDDIIEWDNTRKSARSQLRESILIRNFRREINQTDIIYAQFGLGHILLHDKYKFDTMLTAIEKDDKYSGRALVIDVHCERCELGKSRTAHRPWPLFEDEERGYWGHSSMGFFTDDEHDQFIELLNNQNSIIDLRDTVGKLAELKELYQFMIVLF